MVLHGIIWYSFIWYYISHKNANKFFLVFKNVGNTLGFHDFFKSIFFKQY